MPREIIFLHIGQCGINIGTEFWRTAIAEHGIDKEGHLIDTENSQNSKLEVLFEETRSKRYVPRAVFCDLEQGPINETLAGDLKYLFSPSYMVSSHSTSGGTFARGHYVEGAEISDDILDVYRAQIEKCDMFHGFQLTHSLCGGTGSGLATKVMGGARDNYPDRLLSNFTLYSSSKASSVVEPYNIVLSLHQLVENSDLVTCLDNDSVYKVASNLQSPHSYSKPTFKDLNKVIANAISSMTCNFRFPGTLNSDLRKIAVNLVPFPRLHFFSVAYKKLDLKSTDSDIRSSIESVFNSNDLNLFSSKFNEGCCLSATAMFRGPIFSLNVDQYISDIQKSYSPFFASWIPDHFQISKCDVSNHQTQNSLLVISNSTSMAAPHQNIQNQFRKLFTKKAFLYWYLDAGMDSMEFEEARSNLEDLIYEYGTYEVTKENNDEEYFNEDMY
eukprot:c14778_g1_i1.p1 GENE.c14778_g1_i1~~c14778_g1_i1.p1  ORF type:complete len:443 (+),score=154.36 c14778_g1_i1:24-1352(+)